MLDPFSKPCVGAYRVSTPGRPWTVGLAKQVVLSTRADRPLRAARHRVQQVGPKPIRLVDALQKTERLLESFSTGTMLQDWKAHDLGQAMGCAHVKMRKIKRLVDEMPAPSNGDDQPLNALALRLSPTAPVAAYVHLWHTTGADALPVLAEAAREDFCPHLYELAGKAVSLSCDLEQARLILADKRIDVRRASVARDLLLTDAIRRVHHPDDVLAYLQCRQRQDWQEYSSATLLKRVNSIFAGEDSGHWRQHRWQKAIRKVF